MKKTEKPTPEGAVLRFFRFSFKLTADQLGQKIGVTFQTVLDWENGHATLSREELGEVLAPLDVPPAAIEKALDAWRQAHRPQGPRFPTAPSEEEHRLIELAAAAAGVYGSQAARAELTRRHHRLHARRHRAWAEKAWSRLEKLPEKEQEKAVEKLLGEERSWALAERLCAASETAAAHQASETLRLARLAVRVAEQSPGPESWLLRLRGACEPFHANALRVSGSLTAAEEAFARAEDLWEKGKDGDPAGLLDGTRRLDLKASLLMYKGSFEEARALLDQALSCVRNEKTRGRLLIMKATALGVAGEYEASLEELQKAEQLIDQQREPRLFLVQRFNRANNYCHLDQYQEAKALLSMIEVLTEDLGNELDGIRTLWLRGKTRAGLGHREEGLAALSQVRRYFLSKEIAYDFALVSLELAVLHLEQGRTRLVRALAEEMLWIFQGQRVHKEALAALTLFCQAAEEGNVQAAWTRRLIKYLYRAQYNPRLRFEP
jgi:tetratricopeptide (TPR) repeat protein/DNA-binding XRE family transcriptional regulator